jgi:hypothetical protein
VPAPGFKKLVVQGLKPLDPSTAGTGEFAVFCVHVLPPNSLAHFCFVHSVIYCTNYPSGIDLSLILSVFLPGA